MQKQGQNVLLKSLIMDLFNTFWNICKHHRKLFPHNAGKIIDMKKCTPKINSDVGFTKIL